MILIALVDLGIVSCEYILLFKDNINNNPLITIVFMNMFLNCIIVNLFNNKSNKLHKVNLKTMFLTKKMPITKSFSSKRKKMLFLVLLFGFFTISSFSQIKKFKTVVIDAGHGGTDRGCAGSGSKEKTVVLNIALELGRLIKESHKDIKVVFTRDKDRFVTLNRRAKIANNLHADLFISIHANANTKTKPFGTETYVLGLHRTKAQKNIAARENAVIELEEDSENSYQKITPDKLIARTMQLSAFLNQSITFAGGIQQEFKKLGRKDRGVKQAGFVVLYKTTMPSVLIETGFLTNVKENSFLKQKANQHKMAKAIFNAFTVYKKNQDKIYNEIVGAQKPVVKKPKQEKEKVYKKTNVVFKIQLASSSRKIAAKSYNFKGLRGVERKQQGKYYRYYYGKTKSYSAINKLLKKVKRKGYKDAFLLAFVNGKRIDLKKAILLAEN